MRNWTQDAAFVLRFTRNWIHYGMLLHVFVCTVVAAAEGLLAGQR